MLFRPLDHPLNWYEHDVRGSIELLGSYVADIEVQVDKSIANFHVNADEIGVEGTHPDEPPQFVKVHQGLDDTTWDLREIFGEYFPNLQRRSALITLFSFLEYELNKLCTLLQRTENYNVSFRDIAGAGIERAKTYLLKVASLDVDPAAAAWNEIKNIQALRNLVVHADGRLSSHDGQERSRVVRYVASSALLKGTTEVLLQAGYLKHTLDTFDAYFKLVHLAIKRRYGA